MGATKPRLSFWLVTRGESFTKVRGLNGRTSTLDRIEARAESVVDVIPITRVSDLTRLDGCGVPVFAAITPLAHDLTTHLGKGSDAQAARVSAVMEAIERTCAEDCPGPRKRASFDALKRGGLNVSDPLLFDLPPRTSYRRDRVFDWVEGWDLMGGEPIWILADLARSPAREGVLDQPDTNGLASGATYGEAVRHGLLEVIERDRVGQVQFIEMFGRKTGGGSQRRSVDLATLPDVVGRLVERAADRRLSITLDSLPGDIGVPVMSCTLTDASFLEDQGPALRRFGGWGADLQAEVAASRAITEAFQARLGVIQGARDSYNDSPPPAPPSGNGASTPTPAPARLLPFAEIASFTSESIAKDVDFMLDDLLSIGIGQVVVVDLSRDDVGIPVVRVRVPSLSVFLADRQRPGWRCARHLL